MQRENTTPFANQSISRRNIARGVAWGVPAAILAAPAPAFAASHPILDGIVVTSFNAAWNPYYTDSSYRIKSYTGDMLGTPGSSICIQSTAPSTTVTNLSVWIWYASSTLTFTRNSTYSNTCWTTLTYDASKGTKTYNGNYYYAYKTSYNCAITTIWGDTCLPAYAFESNQSGTYITDDNVWPATPSLYFFKTIQATIDGNVQTVVTGPNPVK